jgi:hypothetical protein
VRPLIFLVSALALAPSAASAKAELSSFSEGPLTVEGGAGIKQEVDGFPIWIGGLPCCQIEVVGTISDGTRYMLFSKNAPASKEIVKLAREAHGNALILVNEPMPSTSAAVSAKLDERRGEFSMSKDDGMDKTPTTFIVIKHSGAAK